MSKILNLGKELIRISPTDKKKIEWSKDGKVWVLRCNASYAGDFASLAVNGNEILAINIFIPKCYSNMDFNRKINSTLDI